MDIFLGDEKNGIRGFFFPFETTCDLSHLLLHFHVLFDCIILVLTASNDKANPFLNILNKAGKCEERLAINYP